MKKRFVIFILLVILSSSTFSQHFGRLDGLENPQGNTILIYSFGDIEDAEAYNSIYKFDMTSQSIVKIMDTYVEPLSDYKAVVDYEFFPQDIENFINVGWSNFWGDYVARNDSIIETGTNIGSLIVDISKVNPNQVYTSDAFSIYRSFDGGYSYPLDSVIQFKFLSKADFDDMVFFGWGGVSGDSLMKSEDQGVTYTVVDDKISPLFPLSFKFFYDKDQIHMYRCNVYASWIFKVSNDQGNSGTWTQTYESNERLYVTIDKSQSGLVYLADGKHIYKSTDYGYNFVLYKSLPRKVVGVYKKPDSEILYAATRYNIYQITPDSTSIIKTVPTPTYELGYYPLAIGNKWFYWETITINSNPPSYENSIKRREVIKDTILANGKSYFKIFDNTTLNDTSFLFERIDSINGLVYRYNFNASIGEEEYLIDDLLSVPGDTVQSSRFRLPQNTTTDVICDRKEDFWIFDVFDSRLNFSTDDLSHYTYGLFRGFGIDSILYASENFSSKSILKGCVINGILFGDTLLTDINGDPNLILTEYKLFQNYPNPFNPSTKINYQLPVAGNVTIKVYDVLGNEIATLVDEYRNAGSYEVEFKSEALNITSLPSGVYFYQLKAGDFLETKKMILLK